MSWLKKLIGLDRNSSRSADDIEHTVEPHKHTSFVAFQPHNKIERMLMDAATNADTRMDFQRALLDVELYAATPDVPEAAGERTVSRGEHISLLNVQSPDGIPVAAIFTAQERIVEVFGMGTGFVAIRGEELLSIVAGQGAWLNPGFPYSVHWTADQLSVLLGKPVPHTIQKDTQIMLGVPADPPTALIAQLRSALVTDRRIVEAWLALAHWPEEGKSSWYLDIRTDLDADEVRDLLAETFRNAD